jgi:hypothetical protein
MKIQSVPFLTALAAIALNALPGAQAADKPAPVPIGHADFVPTPERPIGHRGDGQGWFPGATPPSEWWDGTPVEREILIRPPHAQWDTEKTHKAKGWDFADTKSKNILWRVPIAGWSFSQPTVVGKRLYTACHPYWVVCHDADTGAEIWRRAMTPMLAAGMEPVKAEKLRKVHDLAQALSVINMGYDDGGAFFLFQPPTKRERANPAGAVATKIATCEKILAMIAKHRPDVEAVEDPKLLAALDQDAKIITDFLAKIRAAATPEIVCDEICKKQDRSYDHLRKALAQGYDIPLNWAWYGYVGFADASLTSDGVRLYGAMSQGQIFCYDLDGKLLWARQDGGRSCGTYYTFNRATVVADGVVVQRPQVADANSKQYPIRGFDAATGKILWEVPVDSVNGWTDLRMVPLTAPDGTTVNTVIAPSRQGKDEQALGPVIIRIKDGKVLGNLPELPASRGPHMTWHDGVLTCNGGMDGRAPDPVAFAVRLTGRDSVEVKPQGAGSLMRGDDVLPTTMGSYYLAGYRKKPVLVDVPALKVHPLPRGFIEVSTCLGQYLIGRTGGPGMADCGSGRVRADAMSLERFAVVDVGDVQRPRILSERNLLGYTEAPRDHIIETYLTAWTNRLDFAKGYHGAPSYFGTDMSGVVGHGERIYMKSAAFLYCIGPAIKGTPKDDPKIVAAIRAGQEIAKYLTSDSAQYRYEAVKRAGAEQRATLEVMAKTDPYEEIRVEALRVLGLDIGKPGLAVLRELILKDIVAHHETHTHLGLGDTVMTLKVLGKDADPVMVSLLTDADGRVRRTGAAVAGLWPSGGAAVRDALLTVAADRTGNHANAAVEALSNWPADEKVTALFTKIVADEKDGGFHRPAVSYLMRTLPDAQKNAILVQACKAWNGQGNVLTLLERGALDQIKTLVAETKDRTQSGIITTLAQHVQGSPDAVLRRFVADLAVLALQNPSKDLHALGGIVGWIKNLGADAAPVVPALKVLKVEDANTAKTIADAITEIEAKVAAGKEKK